MLSFRHLMTFITVYEYKSQMKAANILFLSRQTVMTMLREIEEKAGTELYIKGKKVFQPTPYGKYFYEKSKKLVQDYSNLLEASKLFQKKKISLSVNTNLLYILPNLRKSLIKCINTSANEEIVLNEGHTQDQIIQKIENDIIECGLVLAMEKINCDFKSYTIQQYPVVVMMNQNHPLASESITLNKLMKYPLICAANPKDFYRPFYEQQNRTPNYCNYIIEPQITNAIQQLLRNQSAIVLGVSNPELRKSYTSLIELPVNNCFFSLQLIWKNDAFSHIFTSLALDMKLVL